MALTLLSLLYDVIKSYLVDTASQGELNQETTESVKLFCIMIGYANFFSKVSLYVIISVDFNASSFVESINRLLSNIEIDRDRLRLRWT